MRHVALLRLCLIGALSAVVSCAGSSGAPAGPSVTAAPNSPALAAKDTAFDKAAIDVPAGRPFTLVFDNREALAHNVSIHTQSGESLFTGEVFTGPGTRVYAVPALAAGTYSFRCDVHPTMTGTATAR